MGIKDKVLDILFDDNDDREKEYHEDFSKPKKKTIVQKTLSDTGSIFIDATSPLPKAKQTNRQVQEEPATEVKMVNDTGYQMSENISPIFGPIDSKNKKSKNYSKIKSYNEISTKQFDTPAKTQTQPYTSVVISPFYGPISTKPVKKVSKPRKKADDPFDRNINDTGSFDAVLTEQEENAAPDFEDAKEEVIEQVETVGDTDRLVKISDRINKIKNEAASIYSDDSSDEIEEDGYEVETMDSGNISDLIHHVQNYDGKVEHHFQKLVEEAPKEVIPQAFKEEPIIEEPTIVEEPIAEPSYNEDAQETFEKESIEEVEETSPVSIEETTTENVETNETIKEETSNEENTTVEETSNTQVSVDDLFDEEDDVEEGKDLFSVLFGDE